MESIVVLILVLFVFIQPAFGTLFFIAVIAALEIYSLCLVMIYSKSDVTISKNKFSDTEREVIRKHYMFFRLPLVSRSLSATMSAIALSSFLLTPFLLYKGHWIQGMLITINYFIASQLATQLNPIQYLHNQLNSRSTKDFLNASGSDLLLHAELQAEKNAIESVLSKMYKHNA